MTIDRYTKGVLTVIAAALVLQLIGNLGQPASAQQEAQYVVITGHTMSENNPLPVAIISPRVTNGAVAVAEVGTN